VPQVGQEQFVDGQVSGTVGGRRDLTAGGEPLGDQPPVFGLALLGAVATKVEIAAVEGDDRLAGRPVEAVLRRTKGAERHWAVLRIRSTTGFREFPSAQYEGWRVAE
jgi:hypothetical protein